MEPLATLFAMSFADALGRLARYLAVASRA
jgi:hypothetical protein